MKIFNCYDCEIQFEGETREDVLNKLYAHYMSDHGEIITGATEDEKKAWMKQFEKDWIEAKEA